MLCIILLWLYKDIFYLKEGGFWSLHYMLWYLLVTRVIWLLCEVSSTFIQQISKAWAVKGNEWVHLHCFSKEYILNKEIADVSIWGQFICKCLCYQFFVCVLFQRARNSRTIVKRLRSSAAISQRPFTSHSHRRKQTPPIKWEWRNQKQPDMIIQTGTNRRCLWFCIFNTTTKTHCTITRCID